MEPLIIVIVLVGLPSLLVMIWAFAIYNRFVRLRNHIRESWAGIRVELQRRYDLIPNLVETVRGYAAHEQETLGAVVERRNRALANDSSPVSQSADERALESSLTRLLAIAEDYPELKADGHFRELHDELVNTEDRLAATRRFYNANVRDYSNLREQFPTSVIGSMGGFGPQSFFELSDERASQPPYASFDRPGSDDRV